MRNDLEVERDLRLAITKLLVSIQQPRLASGERFDALHALRRGSIRGLGRLAHWRTAPRLLAVLGILSFFLSGCREQSATSPRATMQDLPSEALAEPPEVTSAEVEGFHDLLFYIQEHKLLLDASQTIRAAGTHKGRRLGLEVVLGPRWQSGSLGKEVSLVTYQGTVTYRSTGADSDVLVQVLDELYGTKLSPKAMGRETQFTAISLEGDPRDLAKGPVKIKLFFESGEQDDYAELFTNIDLAARRIEVREKDEEYRSTVVKALRAH